MICVPWKQYGAAVLVIAVCTAVGLVLHPQVHLANIVMVYLLGVVAVAIRADKGPCIVASVLSVAAFDFFFTTPYHSLVVDHVQYLITFAVMLAVSLTISGLTVRVRSEAAFALDRERRARKAEIEARTERARSALLSAVSHDLRTPLATIQGAVSGILEQGQRLSAEKQRELLQTAYDESEHLSRLVHNLLELTRAESGGLQLRKEWQSLEEIVGAALARLERRLNGRPVDVNIPADLPLLFVDDLLIGQVFLNLLENADRHSPPERGITIRARLMSGHVEAEVCDGGPGFAPGEERRVFEKFYRGRAAQGRGAGIGLTICAAIIRAHTGQIEAGNRPQGGACVRFTIPVTEQPPWEAERMSAQDA